MGVLACQPESKFVKAYKDGIHKSKYWEPTLEDALDVCAKVSRIAALVYNNTYHSVWLINKINKLLYRIERSQKQIAVLIMVLTSLKCLDLKIRHSGS